MPYQMGLKQREWYVLQAELPGFVTYTLHVYPLCTYCVYQEHTVGGTCLPYLILAVSRLWRFFQLYPP